MSNLLVVDLGNTNLVLGIYRGDELVSSWRLATARERTADEYGILARQLVGDALHQSLEGAIVASVVPPLNSAVTFMIRKYFGIEPLFVEPGVKTGIAIHVDNPLEVGADRIVNCAAAHEAYGGPAVIVDFGTATTFDVVTANAEFVGGVIAPGLNISAEALFARAARLPRVDVKRPEHVIGTNTVVNMQSGIYFGYLGLVDGILARIKREVPNLKKVVATGGLAGLFAEESEHIDEVDPELTMKGLKLIYDRNRSSRRKK
ncbi:MAG: type III pantothenate kinase [Acidobacteria bacterium]|nr:type III pantothenate kinase [Acidobacteriota bacterium]MBV9475320.1 type III pantothenate kinase [Acidobacteriota bacterium]